jgi:DUF1707 SHOCT-like domain
MDTRPASYPAGGLRVSDADRDRAVSELSEHFQSGRITLDEFEDRSGRALSAKTARELRDLFADLPRQAAPVQQPAQPAGPGAGRVLLVALPVAGFIAIAAMAGGHGHRGIFGGLLPLAIVCLVVLRMAARRRPTSG